MMALITPIAKMAIIEYRYLPASQAARLLIVGKPGTPNPLADRRTNLLPINKLKIGDSLVINKAELPKWKWQLAKTTVKRYNRDYADTCRIVETGTTVEIVRIK